jgi:hypothetical protein
VLGIILQKKEAENIVSSIFLTNEWKGEKCNVVGPIWIEVEVLFSFTNKIVIDWIFLS